jgi:predicted glycosyltransferase
MRIWIDLANSPHVPFFVPLIEDFKNLGHEIFITARNFAQTVELAEKAQLDFETIGGHGGGKLYGKFENLIGRSLALRKFARSKKFDLAVSHNSYSQILSAKILGIKAVTLMDYEHQPANHLAFRLANRVIVPESFPSESLTKFGANSAKVFRYKGIKEDVYLANFEPNTNFQNELKQLGVEEKNVLVVVRPPASFALYHRFENNIFDDFIQKLAETENVKVIFLPRTAEQKVAFTQQLNEKFIVPEKTLDGANLIASADLVVSAGGTMNREAAALGTPTATIYAGKFASIDEFLIKENRLLRISNREDLQKLQFVKKSETAKRKNLGLRKEIADLILETV